MDSHSIIFHGFVRQHHGHISKKVNSKSH